MRLPQDNRVVQQLYRCVLLKFHHDVASVMVVVLMCRDWLGKDEEKARKALHTQYHGVDKTVSALTIKW